MKRTLIISGGEVNLEFAVKYLMENEFDYIIAVDGGLKVAEQLKLVPDCILGDFDTISPLVLFRYENRDDIEINRFMPDKDFTDTEAAIRKALEKGSITIHILGGTGTRLDHTLANIMLLQKALDEGVEAMLVSEKNRIRLIGNKRKSIILKKDIYKYVSLIPLSDEVINVSAKGMKYNVTKHNFYRDKEISMGVSNEIVDKKAEISLEGGLMILFETND